MTQAIAKAGAAQAPERTSAGKRDNFFRKATPLAAGLLSAALIVGVPAAAKAQGGKMGEDAKTLAIAELDAKFAGKIVGDSAYLALDDSSKAIIIGLIERKACELEKQGITNDGMAYIQKRASNPLLFASIFTPEEIDTIVGTAGLKEHEGKEDPLLIAVYGAGILGVLIAGISASIAKRKKEKGSRMPPDGPIPYKFPKT